jgi:hypothetical protein
MPYDPNAPIERIVPLKAEVAVDSSTAEKTPDVTATAESVSDVLPNSQHILNSIDNTWVQKKIEALSDQDGRMFKRYCATFDAKVLPKGAQAWYSAVDPTRKICWLFLRFEAMRNPLFLSGHVPVRSLNGDELERAVHAVVSDDLITDVRQIQVLGFPLNEHMVRQVHEALTNSSKLQEYFPEVIARIVR